MLLTSYVEKPDFLPEEGFGPTLFRIKHFSQAKDLADTCLFVAGVFPTMGNRKGISRRYYQDIGSTSYEMVAESLNPELFSTLAKHFIFLSDFIDVTVNTSKHLPNNLFR
jgi:hypothetical protein